MYGNGTKSKYQVQGSVFFFPPITPLKPTVIHTYRENETIFGLSVLWHPDYALNPDTNPICSFREVLEPGKAQKSSSPRPFLRSPGAIKRPHQIDHTSNA